MLALSRIRGWVSTVDPKSIFQFFFSLCSDTLSKTRQDFDGSEFRQELASGENPGRLSDCFLRIHRDFPSLGRPGLQPEGSRFGPDAAGR